MLVIDIHKLQIPQDAADLRDLEKDGGVGLVADRPPHHAHKRLNIWNMLQRHLADHEIGLEMGVLLGIEVPDEGNPLRSVALQASWHVSGVNAHASVVAQFAQQRQELALAATDFKNVLAVQVVTIDEALRQSAVKGAEGRRKALGLLVAVGIFVQAGIKRDVGDKTAGRAKGQTDVASGVIQRFFPVEQQQDAVNGRA